MIIVLKYDILTAVKYFYYTTTVLLDRVVDQSDVSLAGQFHAEICNVSIRI